MTGVLYRLGKLCVRRRVVVLGIWLVIAIGLVAVSHQMGDNTNNNLSLPGTGSQLATDALAGPFAAQSNGSSPIVIHTKSGKLTDSKYAGAINTASSEVAKAANVESAVSPLTSQGASQLSKNQMTGYISVTTKVNPGSLSTEQAQDIIDAASGPLEGSRARGADRRPARTEGVNPVDGVQRADRNHRGDGDPRVHVRNAGGDGAADHHGDLRARLDARDHSDPRSRRLGADGGADAGDDDRPRGRDRLRPVHRHAPFPRHEGRPGHRRVDRSRGRDLRRRGLLRRLDGHDRARVTCRRGDPARDDDGVDGRDRGRRRGARRADTAAGGTGDHRTAYQLAARAGPPPGVTPVRGRPVGQVGARDRLLPVGCRHRRTRDPDPADDPAAVADSRPAGHRRALDLDHRTPGLRPDQRELRAGRQRPAADRGQAGLAGAVVIGFAPRDAPEGRQSRGGGRGGDAGRARQGRDDRVLQRDCDHRAV